MSFTTEIKAAFAKPNADEAAADVSTAFENALGNVVYTEQMKDTVTDAVKVIWTDTAADRGENVFYSAFFGGKKLGLSNREREEIKNDIDTKANIIIDNLEKVTNALGALNTVDIQQKIAGAAQKIQDMELRATTIETNLQNQLQTLTDLKARVLQLEASAAINTQKIKEFSPSLTNSLIFCVLFPI